MGVRPNPVLSARAASRSSSPGLRSQTRIRRFREAYASSVPLRLARGSMELAGARLKTVLGFGLTYRGVSVIQFVIHHNLPHVTVHNFHQCLVPSRAEKDRLHPMSHPHPHPH